MVSIESVQRRASYGPTSLKVGERGARTREKIVAETLTLFARIGFHETTVRDIADAAGISRATLYQYFESKEEIFVELLDECGGALLAVMRRIGPLGPSVEGYENLREWLVEWTDVYEKYGTLFVQWANVDLPGSSVRGLVSNFLRSYNLRIANRFRRSGMTGIDAREAAIVTTSIIHRFNYLRYVSNAEQPSADSAVRDVAAALQLTLFPSTPIKLVGRRDHAAAAAECEHLEDYRRKPDADRQAQLDKLTPRSAATVRKIIDAGAECFAESGYYQANVDNIVKRAGFARGTFYKYFTEKLDVLLVLSDECEDQMDDLIIRFAQIPPTVEGAEARRQWLGEYLDFRAHYIGIVRTWIDRSPTHPVLDRARVRVTNMVHDSLDALIAQTDLAGVVSVRAGEIMLIGLLERLPDAMGENTRPAKRKKVIDLMATVIERGLLGLDVSLEENSPALGAEDLAYEVSVDGAAAESSAKSTNGRARKAGSAAKTQLLRGVR
jgi:AcrR family transcriptional regulator